MIFGIRTVCLAVLAMALLPAAAHADHRKRPSNVEQPLKDCTRLNGRYGYYGNPWCTPAEQKRWDRWQAGRARGR